MHTLYLKSIRQHKVAATDAARRKFFTLKDLANEMDCHPRTAKRWWKKLRVPPDIKGHGPHRWRAATAARLLKLYADSFNARGTTPQIVRVKYAGDLFDARQLNLFPVLTPNFHAPKNQVQKTVKVEVKNTTAVASGSRRAGNAPRNAR